LASTALLPAADEVSSLLPNEPNVPDFGAIADNGAGFFMLSGIDVALLPLTGPNFLKSSLALACPYIGHCVAIPYLRFGQP
jgi:hypothetical protein